MLRALLGFSGPSGNPATVAKGIRACCEAFDFAKAAPSESQYFVFMQAIQVRLQEYGVPKSHHRWWLETFMACMGSNDPLVSLLARKPVEGSPGRFAVHMNLVMEHFHRSSEPSWSYYVIVRAYFEAKLDLSSASIKEVRRLLLPFEEKRFPQN